MKERQQQKKSSQLIFFFFFFRTFAIIPFSHLKTPRGLNRPHSLAEPFRRRLSTPRP